MMLSNYMTLGLGNELFSMEIRIRVCVMMKAITVYSVRKVNNNNFDKSKEWEPELS